MYSSKLVAKQIHLTDKFLQQAAFALFDKDGNGDISRKEMREAVRRIYRERRALTASLKARWSHTMYLCSCTYPKDRTSAALWRSWTPSWSLACSSSSPSSHSSSSTGATRLHRSSRWPLLSSVSPSSSDTRRRLCLNRYAAFFGLVNKILMVLCSSSSFSPRMSSMSVTWS